MSKIGNKEIARILVDKYGLDKTAAEQFVARMFEVINEGLHDDKQVKVKGLGTFKVTSVAPRKSVDVNSGEPIVIEGRDKISFVADAALRDQVNRPFAQFETVALNDGVDFEEIDRKFEDSMTEQPEQAEDENVEEQQPAEQLVETAEPTQIETRFAEPTEEDEPAEEEPAPEAGAETPAETAPLSLSTDMLAILNGEERRVASPRPVVAVEQEERVRLSPMQLAFLNGQRAEQPPVKEQTKAEPAAEASPTPVETPAPAAENEEERAEMARMREETWGFQAQMEQQHRKVVRQLKAAAFLLLVCVGGLVYMGYLLIDREYRLKYLEDSIVTVSEPSASPQKDSVAVQPEQAVAATPETAENNGEIASPIRPEREAKTVEPQREERQTTPVAKPEPKAMPAAKSAEEPKPKEITKSKAPEIKPKALETKPKVPEAKPKVAETKPQTAPAAQAEALPAIKADARVRTGAYDIVGIERTVTVRAGQTLTSISKSSLGPGMECYVEAVNGGRTEFKAGESIKIPRLKLKKR